MLIDSQIEISWEKLVAKLNGWLEAFVTNTPNIILALAVFTISYFLSRLFEKWFRKYLKNFIRQTSVRDLAANILSVITLSLGLFLALAILNLDDVLKTILASAGVAGLAIGLALQGTLANTFSGISLAINEVIQVGDWIDSNGYSGEVLEINLRNITVKESDNNIVVIPNRLVLQNPFKNYSLNSRIRTSIFCGIHYGSNLKEVRDLAIETITELFPPNPLENIEFYYLEFADSSINFEMRFWIEGRKKIDILEANSKAIIALKKAFDEHNIEIPFPIRTIIQENTEVKN